MSLSISRRLCRGVLLFTLGAGSLALMTPSAPAQEKAATDAGVLVGDPKGATSAKLPSFFIPIPLTAEKPPGITKEPAYRAKPKYAVIHVGNGPKSTYCIAVDEPDNADYKIYFDKNGDGDLTNDGDSAWATKKEVRDRTMYGPNEYVVRASYGTPDKESSSADYGLAFCRFVGRNNLLMYRTSTRTGMVVVDGKPHKVVLVENDADALYSKPLNDDGKPVSGGAETRPVWLMVDMDGKQEQVDARSPFKLGGKPYEAQIAPDGSRIEIFPTTRKVPEAKPLLKVGIAAPNFTVDAWGGSKKQLTDYRGKILVLDFWATWCGPCQASMPHLERVYKAVKNKGVAVLGVCTWDDKGEYAKWVPENKSKYTFPVAFDPAGHAADKSIASSLYNVSGIPTTYIIDKNGNVAAAFIGYDGEKDKRLEAALKKLGVPIGNGSK